MDPSSLGSLIEKYGIGGVSIVLSIYIIRRLDRINELIVGLTQLYTLMITSLPEVKKRSRDEAERIHKEATRHARD